MVRQIGVALVSCCLLVSVLPSHTAAAEFLPLFVHSGAANPVFEGWIPSSLTVNEGVKIGPVREMGVDAWMVDDNSEVDLFVYAAIPFGTQLEAAGEHGWKLSTRLRIVDIPDPGPDAKRSIGGDASPFLLYRDGRTTYQLHFKTTGNGDLYVYLMTDSTVEGRSGIAILIRNGSQHYLQLDLIYDPKEQLVDFYINESLAYEGYSGAEYRSIPVVMWGSGTTDATGQANFNALSFSIRTEAQ